MVKILAFLINSISSSQVLLVNKNVGSFHIFQHNISVYAIFNDQSFNEMITNDIISFEQLGAGTLMLGSQN